MLVICNGGYRTGSTLAYNLIRLLLNRFELGIALGGCAADDITTLIQNYENEIRHALVKTHLYLHEDRRSLAVYTYRNPLDVAASYKSLWAERGKPLPNSQILDILEAEMKRYFCQKVSGRTLLIRYEALIQKPESLIIDISQMLRSPLALSDAIIIAEGFSIERVKALCRLVPKDSADPVTQLRPDHLSKSLGQPGAWRNTLPLPLTKLIVQRCRRQFEDVPEYEEDLHVLGL